jgi:pimeloyl-ACP methyl ester carboxylesterase
MQECRRSGLVFDVLDTGNVDGAVVVLLHGFPQFNTSWDAVVPRLVAHGYRCLARRNLGVRRAGRLCETQ